MDESKLKILGQTLYRKRLKREQAEEEEEQAQAEAIAELQEEYGSHNFPTIDVIGGQVSFRVLKNYDYSASDEVQRIEREIDTLKKGKLKDLTDELKHTKDRAIENGEAAMLDPNVSVVIKQDKI